MLTLHGVERPVVWHVGPSACVTPAGQHPVDCRLSATLTVRRSDYAMRYALPLVGDDVDLQFNLHWSRAVPGGEPAAAELPR
jgi:polyisoprenoid-binding protein YceI